MVMQRRPAHACDRRQLFLAAAGGAAAVPALPVVFTRLEGELFARHAHQQLQQMLGVLRAELDSLLADGIYEDELRRAKDKAISHMVLSSESTFARMRALSADWVVEGRLLSVDEEVERVEKVTTDDVMRVLRRLPLREKQVLTTLGPLGEAELLAV